jgi:cysteine synthase
LSEEKVNNIDKFVLERFEQEIWSKIPHLEETKIVNSTPLVDLTEDFKECAKSVYKLELNDNDLKVYGKFDSTLLSGSIKVRAATHIINVAIAY